MAFSVLLTFLVNDTSLLFAATTPGEIVPYCDDNSLTIFCLLKNNLALAKVIACTILLLVVIGWRPCFTGIFHWWINYSFMMSTPMVDGGEHAATIISFLLIPITLFDLRIWHWQPTTIDPNSSRSKLVGRFVQVTFFEIARLQVGIIYLHAAVGKTRVTEWIDGTALYYWLSDPVYGLNKNLEFAVMPLLKTSYGVALASWGVIIVELLFFVGFFLQRSQKHLLLISGIIFHFLIAVCLGLISFSLIMFGALIILLYERKASMTLLTPPLSEGSRSPQ